MNRIATRRAASIKALTSIKDVTEKDAKTIRALWHHSCYRGNARIAVDAVLRTYGVEYLGRHKRTNDDVHYCNAGDTYSTTVLFIGPHLRVGCWGDLIERGTVATAPDY